MDRKYPWVFHWVFFSPRNKWTSLLPNNWCLEPWLRFFTALCWVGVPRWDFCSECSFGRKWCFLRSSKILVYRICTVSTSWMMSGDFLTISSVPTVKSQQTWVDFQWFPLHTEKKNDPKKTPNKKKSHTTAKHLQRPHQKKSTQEHLPLAPLASQSPAAPQLPHAPLHPYELWCFFATPFHTPHAVQQTGMTMTAQLHHARGDEPRQ